MTIKTLCGAVRLTEGDFAEKVREKCDELLLKVQTRGRYLDLKISRISGVSEVALFLITVVYEDIID